MSIWTKLAGIVVLVLAILAGVREIRRSADAAGYSRAQAETQALATAQAQRNAELMRAAELRYTVIQPVRDRFITNTITEIRHVTSELAACPVPGPAVRLLNDAAKCASSDSPSPCGPGDGLRTAQ